MVAEVTAAVVAVAAATVMATVTEAAWALALLLVFRSTGWAITPAIIRTPTPTPDRITPIRHLITAILHQQWHLLHRMPSRATLRSILKPHLHRPSHKGTGTSARPRMPITPMCESVPAVGSVSPRNRNADCC